MFGFVSVDDFAYMLGSLFDSVGYDTVGVSSHFPTNDLVVNVILLTLLLGDVGWLVECCCISVLYSLFDHVNPLRLEEHDDLEAVPEFSVIASKCDGWVIKDEGFALNVFLPVVAVDGLGRHEGDTTLTLPQPVVTHHG